MLSVQPEIMREIDAKRVSVSSVKPNSILAEDLQFGEPQGYCSQLRPS